MVADRSVTVRLKIDNSDFIRGLAEASAAVKVFQASLRGSTNRFGNDLRSDINDLHRFGDELTRADRNNRSFIAGLNTSGGRMSFLVQSALALGPALVPLGATVVPVIAGLGAELGVAAGAATVAVLAFQGIGQALKAVNDQAIQPTDAHLRAMNLALAQLGPTGQQFVQFLQDARPEIQHLQAVAQLGLFPGLEKGLKLLETQLPAVQSLIRLTAQALGQISAETGKALSGPFWTDFLNFLSTTGVEILKSTAVAIGGLTQGVASLAEAFGPLTLNFTKGFADFGKFFANWAQNLPKTQGFQDFLAFLQDSGPAVLRALEAIGNAIVQIVQAASGLGLVSLNVITGLANAVAAIANSPAGPALLALAAGISAVSRALALSNLLAGGADNAFIAAIREMPSAALKARIGIGALGVGLGVLNTAIPESDKAIKGLVTTASDAAIGFSIGGPWGAAIGAGIGLLSSFTSHTQAATAAQAALTEESKKLASSGLDKQGNLVKSGIADIVTALKDAGAQTDALDLGIPFNKLVIAATGSQVAIDQVTERIKSVVAAAKAARDLVAQKLATETDPTKIPALREQLAATTQTYLDLKFAGDGVLATIDGQNKAVASARQSWEDMKATGKTTNEIWKEMKVNIDAEADSARAAAAAHNLLTDSILQNVEGMIGFRNAVRDAISGAKNFTGSIDSQTKAGDAQKLALAGVADSWNNVTEQAKAAPGAYEKARREFIRVAEAMNVGKQRAQQLADQWLHLPDPALAAQKAAQSLARAYNNLPKTIRTQVVADPVKANDTIKSLQAKYDGLSKKDAKTLISVEDKASGPLDKLQIKVDDLTGGGKSKGKDHTVTMMANTAPAWRELNALDAELVRLTQPKTVTVNVVTNNSGSRPPGRATGGELHGPGTGTSDSIPIMASNGEFVVNAQATSRHLALLHAINASRFAEGGMIGHYASGGRVFNPSELSRIALNSDLPATIRDLTAALADLRKETKDVTEAEKEVKAAREASKQATHALNQVQNQSSQLYKDRLKAQKAADKDLAQAEKNLTNQRDQLTKATEAWRAKQQELIAQAVAVQQAVEAAGSIFGGAGTSVTVAGMLAKINQAAKAGRKFNRNIAELRAEGLDERLIQQLLDNAGTPEAQAAAQNLADAGKRQIAALNRAEGSLLRTAHGSGELAVRGANIVNVKFTGPITTTDVTKLDKKLERRIRTAVRVAASK